MILFAFNVVYCFNAVKESFIIMFHIPLNNCGIIFRNVSLFISKSSNFRFTAPKTHFFVIISNFIVLKDNFSLIHLITAFLYGIIVFVWI